LGTMENDSKDVYRKKTKETGERGPPNRKPRSKNRMEKEPDSLKDWGGERKSLGKKRGRGRRLGPKGVCELAPRTGIGKEAAQGG